MTEPDFTDEQIEKFEKELEDTSLKALIIEQNAILRALYELQVQSLGETMESNSDQSEAYTCKLCKETIVEDKLVDHQEQEHDMPMGVNVKSMYEVVE